MSAGKRDTKEAIRLLEAALQALENPQEKCRQMAKDFQGDDALALAFAAGTARANIKFALAKLGADVDPWS